MAHQGCLSKSSEAWSVPLFCTCVTLAQSLGLIVSTNQECPGVHHPGTTLLRCLGLVWARGLGLTEAIGALGYPEFVHRSLLSR